MDNNERILKHLELIQGVVNRLESNAFLLKGWSMTVLVAGSLLMVRLRPDQPLFALMLLVPVFGFWILDAYFLWQGRLFRAEYDRVRKQDETDFAMIPMQHRGKPKLNWPATFFSKTLNIFYVTEIVFVLVLVGTLWMVSIPAEGKCCS